MDRIPVVFWAPESKPPPESSTALAMTSDAGMTGMPFAARSQAQPDRAIEPAASLSEAAGSDLSINRHPINAIVPRLTTPQSRPTSAPVNDILDALPVLDISAKVPEPAAIASAAAATTPSPPAAATSAPEIVYAPSLNPRPIGKAGDSDPLAPIAALSEEEKIALFS